MVSLHSIGTFLLVCCTGGKVGSRWIVYTPGMLHHQVLKIIKINIFLRPEEAMFENWQKLVS